MNEGAIRLTWRDRNWAEQGHYIYRSDTPMDVNNLPNPIDTIDGNVTEYIDYDVIVDQTYYYRIAAFRNNDVLVSDEIEVIATPVDLSVHDIFNDSSAVSTYNFENNLLDEGSNHNGSIENGSGLIFNDGGGLYETTSLVFDNSYFIRIAPFSSKNGTFSIWIKNIDTSIANPVIYASHTISVNQEFINVFDYNNGTSSNKKYYYDNSQLIANNSEFKHFVVVVQNNVPTIYINSVEVNVSYNSSTSWSGQLNDGSIGGYYVINKGDVYNRALFEIDQVRLFNRPLTPSEVTILYEEGI